MAQGRTRGAAGVFTLRFVLEFLSPSCHAGLRLNERMNNSIINGRKQINTETNRKLKMHFISVYS